MREVVLFPTATLPAIPITYGIFAPDLARKVSVASWSRCVAAT
jgi:hypothetical protein